MKHKVIFICTGNSCRSQIAEGILKNHANNKFEVFSAGSNPSRLHPASISVMQEWGIDISHHKSESLNKYVNKNIDIVITVCDNANQSCPNFPNSKLKLHWNIKDPFHGWSNNENDLHPYRLTRDDLKNRIDKFILSKDIQQLSNEDCY